MKLTPHTPPESKPDWAIFLESLPKKLTLTELQEKCRGFATSMEKAALLRNILARHEQDLPQAQAYLQLAMDNFERVFSSREIGESESEMQGKTFIFDLSKTEFREDGVQFYTFTDDVTMNLEYEKPDGTTEVIENIIPIKSNVFYSNEEVTPEGIYYLQCAMCFHGYISRTALLRIHVEHEAEFFERIAQQPTTATQPEQTKTDATVIPPPEALEIERPTVKQSSIAKAVYHFSFTGKPKSKVIADWIFTHCDVKLNDGTPATSRSLAKEITTVKTDDTRRGQKFKLTLELALLATFPPLE